MGKYIRDTITIEDEQGMEKQYEVEALFDVNGENFALLNANNETILMRVEEEDGEQFLVGLDDPSKKADILDAYEIAVEANPAD